MLMLTGFHPEFGFQEQYFTMNEKSTAYQIALAWHKQGMNPGLYQKTYNTVTVLPLNRARKAA